MAKYKTYNYDQTMMVPVSLTGQLMIGTLEYAIHHLVENRINMSIFESHYKNDETGSPAHAPIHSYQIISLEPKANLECYQTKNGERWGSEWDRL